MSRQEDFKRMAHSHDTESSKYEQECYVDGAEDGYEYAVDKACEWLRENIYHRVYECGDRLGYPTADFLKDFHKAMEE